jgi:probable HAF family extracellular repeat protein
MVAVTLFAAWAIPLGLAAQDDTSQTNKPKHHHYKLIDIGTFGGVISAINFPSDIGNAGVNKAGVTIGFSATSTPKLSTSDPFICGGDDGFGSFITHAFRLQNGIVTDLSALSPSGTNCSNAYRVNAKGEIVGFSENGIRDPLTPFNQSRAVRWIGGKIEDLGSFGGNQNEGLAINNRGQIVGFSLNTISDPYSFFDAFLNFPNPPNGTQTRAFLWQQGQMQDLGALGTGNDASAFMINDRGQITGVSYTNSTPNPFTTLPTVDPFFWENGVMVDLGSFGGEFGQPTFLNNRGQVIGGSSVPADPAACLFEDYPNCHPFLWYQGKLLDLTTSTIGGIPQTPDGINDAGEIVGAADFSSTGGSAFDAYLWRNGVATDLGSVGRDCFSRALAINSQGQVVGNSFSCEGNFHNAFLWENSSIADLNTLIPPNSPLQLASAGDINDRGEIAGLGVPPGVDPSNVFTQGHAFLLTPCDENHPGIEGCDYSLVEGSDAATDVSSAPVSQMPATANQVSPGFPGAVNPMLRLFGRRLGPWYRDAEGQRSAPTVIGSPPSEITSAAPAPEHWIADDTFATPYWGFYHGYCELNGQFLTNGQCFNNSYPLCRAGASSNCPKGQRAISPTEESCGGLSYVRVDHARPCSFIGP